MPKEFQALTRDLPADALPPLHFYPTWLPLLLGLALIAMLLATALWLLFYYLASRRSRPVERESPIRPGDVGREIARIRKVYLESQDYRAGCHALSMILKSHVENRTGLEVEEMTSGEIGRLLRGPPVQFFNELSVHQFGRAEPGREDFEKMCAFSDRVRKQNYKVVARPK